LGIGLSETHGIFPFALKGIQAAEGVQISNLKFQISDLKHSTQLFSMCRKLRGRSSKSS
jgi:hypothetical protein